MATTKRKAKRPGRTGKRDVRISFLSKNPDAKPPISAAKARQLVTEIQAISGGKGEAAEGCTGEGCGQVVQGVKSLVSQLGISVSCRYTCKWFYSVGGGWQNECYFVCNGGGLSIEGTG
jgi:hypothetical protein